MRSIVVGGTSSGVGKTCIAVGLMAAFRRRGLRVQPFKVGPGELSISQSVYTNAACEQPHGVHISRILDGDFNSWEKIIFMSVLSYQVLRKLSQIIESTDFLDPMHHEVAAGRESLNLDGWMLSK